MAASQGAPVYPSQPYPAQHFQHGGPGDPAWEEAIKQAAARAQVALEHLAAQAREDPVIFTQYVLRDEESGHRVRMTPTHVLWQDLITQHPRLLLWSHIESGKSQELASRILWELGRNPNLRCAVISNTHSQAAKIVRAVKRYIETSTDLRQVFPLLPAEPWTDSSITIQRPFILKDPTLQAIGVHGALLGSRLDLVIVDDILDWEGCRTPGGRQALWDWINATVMGRLTSRARLIAIGTAFHPDDLLHRWAASPAFQGRWFKFPVLDSNGYSTWNDRWPLERVEDKRRELGPLEFTRQMLCEPRTDADSRFKRDWINLAKAKGEGKVIAHHLEGLPSSYRIITGVDLAVQQHAAADWTALTTLVAHPDGLREVVCVEAGKWAGPEIVERLADTWNRYHGTIVVESNAAQDFIRQFAGLRGIPTLPYTTGRSKAHPEFGIESVAAEMAGGRWVLPNMGGICHPEVEALCAEMQDYRPDAHCGDRLMSLFLAREGIKMTEKVRPLAQRGYIGWLNR